LQTETLTLLSAADAYVTTSRIEGMPVAPLEAMPALFPSLPPMHRGFPTYWLANGQESGGLMVRKDQPEEIAHALKRLKDDPHLRERLVRAARKRIEQYLSLAAVADCSRCLLTKR
jgi:glycosyltransferase involved in cell wall biosynthesis